MKIFCDMDGVLTNLGKGRREMGPDCSYEFLEWMPDGKVLWQYIEKYNPTILSAAPDRKIENAGKEKTAWCRRELGNYKVIVTPDSVGKHPYSGNNHILIDDNLRFGRLWEQSGGIYIKHITTQRSIEELTKIIQ